MRKDGNMNKLKRLSGLAMVIVLILSLFAATGAYAEEDADTPDPMEQEPGIPNSAAGILYETTTGTVLFEENADEVRAPASMTKVMTAIIVLEQNPELEGTLTVSEDAVSSYYCSSMTPTYHLEAGEEISYKDCMQYMLVCSANEAATSFAFELGDGDFHAFVDMMNEKAKELGCENTSYMDPTGISSSNKITARDMVKIAEYAMTFDAFREAVSHKSGTIPPSNVRDEGYDYYTTNYVMFPDDRYESPYSQYMTGVKTGWIPASGYNFTGCLEKDGYQFISVVMGGEELPYDEERIIQGDFVDTISLYRLTDDFEPPADYTWIYIGAAVIIVGAVIGAVVFKSKKKKG